MPPMDSCYRSRTAVAAPASLVAASQLLSRLTETGTSCRKSEKSTESSRTEPQMADETSSTSVSMVVMVETKSMALCDSKSSAARW